MKNVCILIKSAFVIFLLMTIACKEQSNYLSSQLPPQGIPIKETPQFVVFSFDDNAVSGIKNPNKKDALAYIDSLFKSYKNPTGNNNSKTYDGNNFHYSYYVCPVLITKDNNRDDYTLVKKVWRQAYLNGNEIGNHTFSHPHGINDSLSKDDWVYQMNLCHKWLLKPYPEYEDELAEEKYGIGVKKEDLTGFRTPYIGYNRYTFEAIKEVGFAYDASIEDGFQDEIDGTNFYWPWYLSKNKVLQNNIGGIVVPEEEKSDILELPLYVLIVPPDDKCEEFGVKPGLRDKLAKLEAYKDVFSVEEGKIRGSDYNLWFMFGLTKDELLASVKYTIHLRLKGNRCPFLLTCHGDTYAESYETREDVQLTYYNSTAAERRDFLKEILDYISEIEEVRVVSSIELVNWLKNPKEL